VFGNKGGRVQGFREARTIVEKEKHQQQCRGGANKVGNEKYF